MEILYILLSIIFLLIFLIYYWALQRSKYWQKYNVPNLSSLPFIGNFKDIVTYKRDIFEHMCDIYFNEKFKNQPIIGYNIFYKPALIIREPELIKRIFATDFNCFSNRHTASDEHADPMGSATLFFAKNPNWRQIRTKLSPMLSSGRIKKMFYLINAIGIQLNEYLLKLNSKTSDGTIMELKDLCARYTTDVIANSAFGIEVNSIENPNCEFRRIGKLFFEFSIRRSLQLLCFIFLPEWVPIFKLRFFSKEIEIYFRNVVSDIMEKREASGEIRNDVIDSLIQFKNEGLRTPSDEISFIGDVLVAQAVIYFQGGFETSSSLMSFGLFELAWNKDVQDRLREEIKINLIKYNGEITYEMIIGMEYLQMVLAETLRLYPPLPFIDRQCKLPNDKLNYDLKPFYDYKIPNGMPVLIPVYAIHRDPTYFPEPSKFDPERFSKENKLNIPPYAYMPFGHGPRNCIGELFGLTQSKVGLVHMLKNHYVEPTAVTPRFIKYEKKSIGMTAESGIVLNVVKDVIII